MNSISKTIIKGTLVVAAFFVAIALGSTNSTITPHASACTWVTTSCGSGCADNKDLYNCSKTVTIKTVTVDTTSSGAADSNAKAAIVAPPTVTQYIPPSTVSAATATTEVANGNTGGTGATSTSSTAGQTVNAGTTTINQTWQSVSTGTCLVAQGTRCLVNTGTTSTSTSGGSAICSGITDATALRQCLVTSSGGMYGAGGCLGLTIAQCIAKYPGMIVQTCSGVQQTTGSKMGEFLSCVQNSGSNTGGCGQVDIIDQSGNLLGFVIDKTGTCTTTNIPPSQPPSNPTPTPTPSPTPTPTPPPFVCLSITKDVASPSVGSAVRFTCGTTTGADSYQFQYRIDGGAVQSLAAVNPGSNISVPLSISKSGNYDVECTPCKAGVCLPFDPLADLNPTPTPTPSTAAASQLQSNASPTPSPTAHGIAACPQVMKQCPDGSTVGYDPNGTACTYLPCPSPTASPTASPSPTASSSWNNRNGSGQ